MRELLVQAELIKLSRVLGAKDDAVDFLAPLGVEALRRLENRISDVLFNEHRTAFQKLADASRLLPASLVAKMSELVFGPMLSARIAGLMQPDRAIEVAARLKTKFLADVTMEMDPRSASELLRRMPAQIVVDVARLLLQRREYVTMGRFVDDLTDEAIRRVSDSITDDEALVRIGFFVERRERLRELVDLLSDERLRRVVTASAIGPVDVQNAGLAMMSQLGERQQGRFGEAAIALGPRVLNALVAVAQREQATDIVGAVMQNVGERGRATFAKMLADMDSTMLAGWARATTEAQLWPPALHILAAASAEIQQQAAAALGRLGKAERAPIAAAVKSAGLEGALGVLRPALSR